VRATKVKSDKNEERQKQQRRMMMTMKAGEGQAILLEEE